MVTQRDYWSLVIRGPHHDALKAKLVELAGPQRGALNKYVKAILKAHVKQRGK